MPRERGVGLRAAHSDGERKDDAEVDPEILEVAHVCIDLGFGVRVSGFGVRGSGVGVRGSGFGVRVRV